MNIHFILPGGGVKGSFQGGFLYELLHTYSDHFTVSRIDGTSVGALNGYAFALGKKTQLRDTWFKIEKLEDIFEPFTNLPILNAVSQGYKLVNQYGIYNSQKLANLIYQIGGTSTHTPTTSGWGFWEMLGFSGKDIEEDCSEQVDQVTGSDQLASPGNVIDEIDNKPESLTVDSNLTRVDLNVVNKTQSETESSGADIPSVIDKFYCVVVSLREGVAKYINGDDPLIGQYVHASACPWIISPPHHLGDDVVTDGGLIESYPTQALGKCGADLTVLVGYDSTKTTKSGHEGNNFLAYFNRLIDISRCYLPNVNNIKRVFGELGERGVIVNNPLEVSYLDFNPGHIQRGFFSGQEAAHQFAKKYLLKNTAG
jgi:predicted acylesterase/phospholipase RssA